MILDNTTRTIEVVLAGAVTTNQLPIVATYGDSTSSDTTMLAVPSLTNSTTAVTVIAAPAASTQRRVIGMSVYNADTASATVMVRYNDNGTIYPIIKIAVPSGYTLQYTLDGGWSLISASGSLQTGVAGPSGAAGTNGTDGVAKLNGINDQTGTSYTLVLTDAGKDVRCTNASAITLTVPPNSSVAFPIASTVLFSQGGAGVVTATAGSGVTLRASKGSATAAQYDIRGLEKTDTDTWRVI
jgi:hypothetical protein